MFKNVVKNDLGFFEIYPKPNPADLKAYYKNKYWQEVKKSSPQKYSQEELNFIGAKLTQRYQIIFNNCDFLQAQYLSSSSATYEEPPTMLDVGSGEGFTLSFLRKRDGWLRG